MEAPSVSEGVAFVSGRRSWSLGKVVLQGIPICMRRIGTVSCRRVQGGTGIEIGLNNSLDGKTGRR